MQLATNPRFRTDLVAECIEDGGQRFIDVIDPDTDTAFRFYEVEYSLACAMDGERDVAGLVQWAKEELGIEPSPAELQQVISTLGGLGYLEAAEAAASAAAVAQPASGDDDYGLRAGVHHARSDEPIAPAGDVELGRPTYGRPSADDAMPSGGDFELGNAGGSAPVADATPPVDDLELGGAGFNAAAEPVVPTLRRGKTRPDIDDDGPTNLPPADTGSFDDDEVSVDLSQHLGDLGRDDVKEAVRMSRSMQAVAVPQDLLDQIGEQEAAIAASAQRAKDEALEARRQMDEVKPPVAEVRDVKPPEPVKPVAKPEPKPKDTVKPPPSDKKPEDHAKPVAVAEPSGGGVSTILVVLLVLALLGGGAFFVWKYVLNDKKSDDTAEVTAGSGKTRKPKGTDVGTSAGTGTAAASGTDVGTASGTGMASGTDVGTGAGTGTDVAAPPAPTATLAEVPGQPIDIMSGGGGTVSWAAGDGVMLQAGDPVVQYKGVEYFKVELGNSKEGLIKEIEVSVPGEIDKATAARDKALAAGNTAEAKKHEKYIAERTKRLEQKKEKAAKLQAKIDGFTVKTDVAGTVHPKFTAGKKVGKNQVVAQLDGAPVLTAKFTLDAEPADMKVDDSIRIAPKGELEKVVTCMITAIEGKDVTVTCSVDTGLMAGTEVQIAP